MKKLLSLMMLSFVLCGSAIAQWNDRQWNDGRRERPQAERITHGPVVESIGPSWAVIAWSTNTGGSSIVRYGTDWNRLSQMAEAPYADDDRRAGQTHRVTINHLWPGTTYYFIVDSAQGEGTGTEASSRVEQFTTRR